MSNFFMGQELAQPELPANSPRPHETPEDGVIVTDVDPDGYTRRYLYKSMGYGKSDQVLISETLTHDIRMSGSAVMVQEPPPPPPPKMGGKAVRVEDPPPIPVSRVGGRAIRVEEPILNPDRLSGKAVWVEEPPSPPRMAGKALRIEEPVASLPPRMAGIAVPIQDEINSIGAAPIRHVSPEEQMCSLEVPDGAEAPMIGDAPKPFNFSKRKGGFPRTQAAQVAQVSPIPSQSVSITPSRSMETPSISQAQVQVQGSGSPLLGSVRLGGFSPPPAQVRPSRYEVAGNPEQLGSVPIHNSDSFSTSPTQLMVNSPSMGGSTSFLRNEVRIAGMGQAAPAAPAPVPAPAPAPASAPQAQATPGKCPGAIQMPDGTTLNPEDYINLNDLCEIVPLLVEALDDKARALAPGQKVPVVGSPRGGSMAVPSGSSFGPAGGVGAGGGGGFGFGGGGGPGPRGVTGPQGPVGPVGLGGSVDSITKTDGDFTAGPGSFISVPGTLITFSTAIDAPAVFYLLDVLGDTTGGGNSQSGQIGLRIDGTDYSLATRLLHTFVGGVGEFLIGQSATFTLSLGAGSHTVEVVLRGLAPGEFGGTSLGTPCTVAAIPDVPLQLSVSHS